MTFSFVYDVNRRHIQALMLNGLDAAGGVSQGPIVNQRLRCPHFEGFKINSFAGFVNMARSRILVYLSFWSPASF